MEEKRIILRNKRQPNTSHLVSVEEYMNVQKEYDLNKDHIDSIGFWDIFNEKLKDKDIGFFVDSLDKESPGMEELRAAQRNWNNDQKAKRIEAKRFRDYINRGKRRNPLWRAG